MPPWKQGMEIGCWMLDARENMEEDVEQDPCDDYKQPGVATSDPHPDDGTLAKTITTTSTSQRPPDNIQEGTENPLPRRREDHGAGKTCNDLSHPG